MSTEEVDVVVIGAGQAGLAASHELAAAGIEHVVLERRTTVGGAWQDRWDSFCLVSPNDTIRLPGGEYRGPDPHGFLPGAEVARHLRDYAASFAAPVRTGVAVTALRPRPDGGLDLRTAGGLVRARAVVVATGAFQEPNRPAWAAEVPVPVLDATEYRNPAAVPEGDVLIIGSGQCGCQIAEELTLAGRRVVLACGRAPWGPRRFEGRDLTDWLVEFGFFDVRTADLPDPSARLWANPQLTGASGGHDLNTRTLQALGVGLAGHLAGIHDGAAAVFTEDLAESVAWGDARYADLRSGITRWRTVHRLPVPEMPVPEPFDASAAVGEVALRDLGAIILATGFHPAYQWIEAPNAFDSHGFPLHVDGASTVIRGLWFVGVHFLRARKSALLLGVGEDAAVVARDVAESVGAG